MQHEKVNSNEAEEAHKFLKTHPLAVISTVSADGKPWGAAIYCVADDNFNFFFVTRENTQKFQNIDQNSRVALTFANPESQQTIQVSGVISKVPGKDIIDVVFHKLDAVRPKHDVNWSPPVIKVHQGDWMVLQVTPDYAQYANYGIEKRDPNDSYIRSLI